MTYRLVIRKNATGDWIVAPEGGPATVKPGDTVAWSLQGSPQATAHLQFCEDIFEPSSALNAHWVSAFSQGRTLELKVAAKALPDPRVRRRTVGYAVMVVDGGGAQYAFGSNPPPDLDVGN